MVAHGQSTSPRLLYTQRVWHVQDGLPEETVQAVQQAPQGYLWIGTTGGLVRFDGSRFVTYSRSTSPGISENSVFCLAAVKDGSLWFGTEGGGLVHLDRGSFHNYGPEQGLTDSFVRSVMEDSAGRLWVGTDNGLFRIEHDRAVRVDTSQVTLSLAVHAIYEDREHRVWVGGSRLLMFSGGQVHAYRLQGAYSQNRVKSIVETSDGTVWVGTVSGLQRLRNGRFEALPGLHATVRTLREMDDATLWIGTIGHGLFLYSHGALQSVAGDGLLPSKTVLSLATDNAHQMWIGTQDGLTRLSRTPVGVVPLPGGSDPDFETISWDPEGTVWVAASQVYAIRQSQASSYRFPQIAGVPVRNVFRDREGGLWIGSDGSGAYRISAEGVAHYSAPESLSNNFVRGFLESRDHAIWIATDEGVTRIAGGHAHIYRMRDGLAYFSTRSLIEDRDGRIWIGTEQGLSCWTAGQFTQNEATRALAKEKIWSILQDHSGTIWFGTRDHGIFRYRGGKLEHFTTAQGLTSNSVYQLLEDRFAQLWVSSPDSISSIPLAAFDATQPDTQSDNGVQLPVTTYGMPFDASGAQMYGGRQPAGCVDRDGGLWFPSSKGALHIVPEPAPRLEAPAVVLTDVTVDGQVMPASALHKIPADTSRLEFSYSPLSLRAQGGAHFRYRLEPFDKQWTYAGSTRVAAYTNLPAGRYVFRVVAFPWNNPASASETSLVFRKPPHFYASWWFLSLCVVMAGVLALLSYRWRMRSLELRFRAVLAERSRLAREMHDTVIQGCTSISALLEAISSLEREGPALQQDLLDHARTQVRTTIDEARQAVWNLRHGEEPKQDIAAAIESMAEHTSREFGVPISCRKQGSAFLISRSAAHEILMVVREAMYNAVMHGHPAQVWIELDAQGSFLFGRSTGHMEAVIRDDGVGFDPGAMPDDGKPHYGIAGMRERIERLQGEIHWESSPGAGTIVRLSVPWQSLARVRVREEMKV
ncbi:two-component regulator propeller domain-containing protein [Silvibacterium sp.]|uniref:sensor histidine kinase n=1 Tax=Silvibacterium sp. TaxID=1964179 RepID=UPI0039E31E66